jgi:hypothetical protein
LLKNWFSKKEKNYLTLIKETSLFIRSWCVYYKIVSTYFTVNYKALYFNRSSSFPMPLIPPLNHYRNDLCLPNYRLGRHTAFPSPISDWGGISRGFAPTFPFPSKAWKGLSSSRGSAPRRTLTKYYDFLVTKLIWKKVFSLLGKTSRRFLGNQRYLNSSNNLTKILYKFFLFIKKEHLWVFIQLLPQCLHRNL